MVADGILLDIVAIAAGVIPKWTGWLLILGVSLNLLFHPLAFPDLSQIVGSIVRNTAFIGTRIAVLESKKSV